MSYQQTKKLTAVEKKLQALKTQLYGKSSNTFVPGKQNITADQVIPAQPQQSTFSSTAALDTTYLKHDLLKIFLLASLALGVQVLLFILTRNGIIKF
jgi:hypothetical protein